MGLKKSKIIKGLEVDYWKIINCDVKTGMVILGLFNNRECGMNRENLLERKEFTNIIFPVDIECPLAFAYNKITESRPITNIITPAKEAVLDEAGNVIEEAVEAVTETIETNEWASAEDC